MRTYVAKSNEINRKWHLINAEGKILGRVAVEAAKLLMGKPKPIYTPYIDSGDGVIVVNAAKIKVTGKKMQDKTYNFFSGYPGGLKQKNLETMLKRKPAFALQHAVKGMLPKGPLGRKMFKKCKVYPGAEHKHASQNLQPYEI